MLVARVHPDILESERVPTLHKSEKAIWHDRYQSINDFEKHLHRSGTRIIKFFLHLSKNEQRKRFLDRIDEPDKNWKFSNNDIQERKYWDKYMKVYESCLSTSSTLGSPWYIIPADNKKNARLIMAKIILKTLEDLKMSYPMPTEKRRKELLALRKQLEK